MINNALSTFLPLDELIYDTSRFYALLMFAVGQQCKGNRINGAKIIGSWHYRKYCFNIFVDNYIIRNKPLVLFNRKSKIYCNSLHTIVNAKSTNLERLSRFNVVVDIALSLIYNTRIESGYIKCSQCKKVNHCTTIKNGKPLCSHCIETMLLKVPLNNNCGYVYILEAVGFKVYKIGRTKNIDTRMKTLIKLPFDTKLIHTIKTDNPTKTELELHRKFADLRVNGEWFKLSNENIEYLIKYQDETT